MTSKACKGFGGRGGGGRVRGIGESICNSRAFIEQYVTLRNIGYIITDKSH